MPIMNGTLHCVEANYYSQELSLLIVIQQEKQMITVQETLNRSWTSLYELFQGEEQPFWSPEDERRREIEAMVEQNRLLKRIKQNLMNSKGGNSARQTLDTSNENSKVQDTRSTISSQDSASIQKRTNKPSRTQNLVRPIHKNQSTPSCEYQKLLRDVEQLLTPGQYSLLANLVQEVKLYRSNCKQLTNKQFALVSQLAQANITISNLEAQLSLMHAKENTIKSKEKELVLKEKSLGRAQMVCLLKQKTLFEQSKKVNLKLSSIHGKEQKIQQQRNELDEIYSQLLSKTSLNDSKFKEEIFQKCRESLKLQRETLLKEQQQLQEQHQYMLKLVSQIQSIKPAQ